MKTLYIDINNKPIQETDEIKLFTDEGSLQYAFFYELGSQLVGKVGKSIKKAKLISDFDSPENAESFQKIIRQWNLLKAMLFGEDMEESFDVVIPKEFIAWMSVHVDNEYRSIAVQYDKTKDYTVTIDVESFFEDAVDDEFKRNIVKVLKADSKIEQFVFNDDAVTKRSRIVKSIREKSDVVFVPFEKWNEIPPSTITEDSVIEECHNYNPLVIYSEEDQNVGGFRILVKSLYDTANIVFEDYVDKIIMGDNCVFIKRHKVDKEWIAITAYGQTTAKKESWRYVDVLPRTRVENKFPKCKAIHKDDNLFLVNRGKGNENDWILYELSTDSITELTPNKFLQNPERLDYDVIKFQVRKKTLFFHVTTKTWFDDVFKSFAVKIVNGNRCEVYSLLTGNRIITNATVVYVSYSEYDKQNTRPTIIVSEDGKLGCLYDSRLNKRIVFNHDGEILYLESNESLLEEEYHPEHAYFSDSEILIKQHHSIISKDINGNVNWKVETGEYDDKVSILAGAKFGYTPCIYRHSFSANDITFCLIHEDKNTENCAIPLIHPIITWSKNVPIINIDEQIFRAIRKIVCRNGIKSNKIRTAKMMTPKHLIIESAEYVMSSYLFTIEKESFDGKFIRNWFFHRDNFIVYNADSIICYTKDGELISEHKPSSYNQKINIII